MPRNTRDTVYGIVSGATWRTPVAVVALSGFFPTSVGPLVLQGDPVPDESIGFSEVEEMDVVIHEANPTIVTPMRREGQDLFILAGWMGDDTVTGAGPFVHTMNYQDESALFYTMAKGINSNADIIEWPSIKVNTFEIGAGPDGFAQLTGGTIGDTINIAGDATNDGTSLGNVTFITRGVKIPFRETRFRINAQGGGALGSGDVIPLADFTLSGDRGMDREDLTQGASTGVEYTTDEPVRSTYGNLTLSTTVPDYTTIALLDDMHDETEYKADLFWSKTVASVAYTFLIELGRLHPMPYDINAESGGARYPLTRNFRCVNPTSTPTGMATANPIHIVTNDNHNVTYE